MGYSRGLLSQNADEITVLPLLATDVLTLTTQVFQKLVIFMFTPTDSNTIFCLLIFRLPDCIPYRLKCMESA
jgi:hypothetical protein